MKFGVSMFCTDRSAAPGEVAAAIEARGFDSYWISEHSHIPLREPHPFTGFDPRTYAAMLDPFVALTAAAAATQRIMLGTAITLIIQRDTINCAKSVASVDHLSGGRMLFGIGAGWNQAEMEDHGTDPSTRFRLMRERVEAMKVLWSEEVASYSGRMVQFEDCHMWPKPVQKPNPPVYIAGSGPNILKRVVRYGDGWLPVVPPSADDEMKGRVTPIDEFAEMVPQLKELAEAAGRPMPGISVMGAAPTEDNIARCCELGVERMILGAMPAPLDEALEQLENLRAQVVEAGAKPGEDGLLCV